VIQPSHPTILERIRHALRASDGGTPAVAEAMHILAENLPHFKWVGVYWLAGGTLELGPYIGAATEHTRIPVGRGVCGTAVAQNHNQLVRDVRELDNYLACSLTTRAEIVVLIRDPASRILGQIDADGDTVGAFDERDEALLTQVARLLADHAPAVARGKQ